MKTRKIKQISVSKLFGLFDHVIPLDQDERATLLVGPSGLGKTVILRLLADLFSPNSKTLQEIPFQEFRVDFANEEEDEDEAEDHEECQCRCHKREKLPASLWVTKADVYAQDQLTFHSRNEEEQEQSYLLTLPPRRTRANHPLFFSIEDPTLFTQNYGNGEMQPVLPEKEILSYEDLLRRSQEPASQEEEPFPDWLREIRQAVPIYLIGTQRLSSFLVGKQNGTGLHATVVPTVKVYAEELAQTILTELAKPPEPAPTDPWARKPLTKLQRIQQLLDNLNEFFTAKKIAIDRIKGLVLTNASGVSIAPEDLSLGEQHAFVLFYQLYFKVAPHSLVLIDEPEASFHITPQEKLCLTLSALTGAMSDSNLLAVTHSPYVIGERWNRTAALKG